MDLEILIIDFNNCSPVKFKSHAAENNQLRDDIAKDYFMTSTKTIQSCLVFQTFCLL